MAFYRPIPGSSERNGKVEFRDENFKAVLLDVQDSLLVKELAESEWHEMSFADLKQLTRSKMHESLLGLKELLTHDAKDTQ